MTDSTPPSQPTGDDNFLDPQPPIEDVPLTRPVSGGDAVPPADEPAGDPTDPDEADEPDEPKRSRAKQWLKELPIMLGVAFVIAVLLKSFVVQAFWIPSGSMEQTLHGCPGCSGDRILVNRMSYWFTDPKPGEIIVFEAGPGWDSEVRIDEPDNPVGQAWLWLKRMVGAAPPGEKDLVKRVIAVGGQTVQCCDAEGRVTVDGVPLNEPYVYFDPATPNPAQQPFGPVTVPDGRLFVMGDHRNQSADSRFHLDDQWQGTIAVDSVVGRAFVIIWPFDRFTWLTPPDLRHGALAVSAYVVSSPPLLSVALVLPIAAWRSRRRSRMRR